MILRLYEVITQCKSFSYTLYILIFYLVQFQKIVGNFFFLCRSFSKGIFGHIRKSYTYKENKGFIKKMIILRNFLIEIDHMIIIKLLSEIRNQVRFFFCYLLLLLSKLLKLLDDYYITYVCICCICCIICCNFYIKIDNLFYILFIELFILFILFNLTKFIKKKVHKSYKSFKYL